MMQTQINSRATTLPQLNNEALMKSQAIKQNKSQSFYEGIRPQGSFKVPPAGTAIMKNEFKVASEPTTVMNNSYNKGSVSPMPFDN